MHSRTLAILGIFLTVFSLAACTSRPELAQVPPDAQAQPINTPEAAQSLREKYEI